MVFGSTSSPSVLSSLLSSASPFSRKNKLRSADNETAKSTPTFRSRGSATSSQFSMGQAHPKATAYSPDVYPYAATGAGPATLYTQDDSSRRGVPLPPMPEPPCSAPLSNHYPDDPFSRPLPSAPIGDRSSHRSKKSIASGTKTLARKLSTKAKMSRGPDDFIEAHRPTVNDKLKAFEQMVAAAEQAVGIDATQIAASGRKPRRPSSQPRISHEPPASAAPLPSSAFPFQFVDTPPPDRGTRPVLHRRNSSGSTKSTRASIKSTRRAEREWRARVAAMAHASSSHSSPVQLRGPVPPKRTPAANKIISRESSPELDSIVTPPQAVLRDDITPAKPHMSNQSFRTLGYFGNGSASATQHGQNDMGTRERKASVPRSVMSSFHFDPTSTSRVSTRPSSFAASHLLGPAPSEAPSPLQHAVSATHISEIAPRTPDSHRSSPKISLPPFETFDIGLLGVRTPARGPPSPALPESAVQPRQPASLRTKRASAPANSVEADFRLQVSINKAKTIERYNTIPPRSQGVVINASGVSVHPASFSLDRLPARATPSQASKAAMPTTPLSPTTEFLMTAPVDSLNLGSFSFDSPERSQLHPYSVVPVKFDNETIPAEASTTTESRKVPFPSSPPPRERSSATEGPRSFDPFSAPPKKRKEKPAKSHSRIDEAKSKRERRPTVLQAKKTQPTAAVLGSGYDSKVARSDLERQRVKLKKMGVDLTPGMENGMRPPKSGLPRDRWLSQTSLDSA